MLTLEATEEETHRYCSLFLHIVTQNLFHASSLALSTQCLTTDQISWLESIVFPPLDPSQAPTTAPVAYQISNSTPIPLLLILEVLAVDSQKDFLFLCFVLPIPYHGFNHLSICYLGCLSKRIPATKLTKLDIEIVGCCLLPHS
jgi:hypothetical protein